MAFPLIGITTYQDKNSQGLPTTSVLRAYCDALVGAGGAPLLIPHSSASLDPGPGMLLERLDGILFTGGGDLDPARYQASDHAKVTGVDPERDALEMQLLEAALALGKPFLGICRGLQLINVYFGGDLYADILEQRPGALKHDYFPDYPRDHLAHQVMLEPGGMLQRITREARLQVNSLHHQGIRGLAAPLKALATSEDGLVEGVLYADHPYGIALQWHPEWLTGQVTTRQIFASFITACRG
jgi:putative glutamine amidotransferase